jgi:hypothetical protein
MKKLALFLCSFLYFVFGLYSQVAVNFDGTEADPSAMLDVKSPDRGLLPPRVALTALNSAQPVVSPAAGLLVYNTAVAGNPPNNVVAGYYFWNGTKWSPVAPPQGTGVGDILCWNGTQWVGLPVGTSGEVLTINNGLPSWEQYSYQCGIPVTVSHVAGPVAPVSKTVIYGTIANIPGEPSKCWITSNLGADHQAASNADSRETAAGWYWQFNLRQGYKHDGTVRTPGTAWIASISESSDWIAANDPCTIELGTAWRIPTSTEWTNVDAAGGWTNWNGPFNSGLKLHGAGYLAVADGSLNGRGTSGFYWSSVQYDAANGARLFFSGGLCAVNNIGKAFGFSVRCLRDN